MNNTVKNLKSLIKSTLEGDERLWFVNQDNEQEFNQTLLLDLIEKVDNTIIGLLLQEEVLREKFFVKIVPPTPEKQSTYVFKTNEFRFFMEENKVDNSYTSFKNRIGLTDGKKFLKDSSDIVLDWPYKDCVLEGGQSTEEGADIYFEYDTKSTPSGKPDTPQEGNYIKKQGKRKEIFFNQVLAQDEIDRLLDPKALVNWKRFTKDGQIPLFCNPPWAERGGDKVDKVDSIKRNEDGTIAENLIIKGNNLLALHSLKKQFRGKVKLIYIDPPYNTGNDGFKYNDNFNHSTWLTFMKNRLEVARELLRDDGVIFVQCDDNEQAYLKILMDEVFGRENFETSISNIVKPEGRNYGNIAKAIDFILVYFKNKKDEILKELESSDDFKFKDRLGGFNLKELRNGNSVFNIKNRPNLYFPIYVENTYDEYGLYNISLIKTDKTIFTCYPPVFQNGIEGVWRWGKEKTKNESFNICAKKVNNSFGIFQKRRKNTFRVKNIFNEKDFYTSRGNIEMKVLGYNSFFTNPKPEGLIQRIIEISTNPGDIVLDYHLGSGTTCAVAHKMGRQYIGIEQMDYIETIAVERLKKVIGSTPSNASHLPPLKRGILDKEDNPQEENIPLVEGWTAKQDGVDSFDTGGISKAVNWQGGGDFVYLELAKWNQQAKEIIQAAESLEEMIGFLDELSDKYFLNYNLKMQEFREKIILEPEFQSLSLESQKAIFMAMLDNNQMYVNKSEMADEKFGISEEEQKLTEEFYK